MFCLLFMYLRHKFAVLNQGMHQMSIHNFDDLLEAKTIRRIQFPFHFNIKQPAINLC
ncbi:hypothetical protein NC653_008502 [Populus alba x Populus x berolinensis]|uniref:Uncharacterized protein n=1 Tax=Populus alba x Populus x berolinensis TaxID=444605 RepID=A0AAD6R6S7_9ROSI|nr:hypothetical protein NC653_008502 [Populus alba x Populus x berolinensis]